MLESTGETSFAPELAWRDTAVVAEKTGEMRGFGKAELMADVGNACRLIEHRVDRLLHPNDVEIDLGRHADGGFEQAEEMRAREPCLAGKGFERGSASGFGSHRGRRFSDAPVAGAQAHFTDRGRKAPPRREALDHRDH